MNTPSHKHGAYLATAGFTKGTFVSIAPTQGVITIRPSDTATDKRVQEKDGRALLDLNAAWMRQALGDAAEVHVRVADGEITIRVHPLEARVTSRPTDGSVVSCFSGMGALDDAAVEAGFTPRAGIEIDGTTCETLQAAHPGMTVCHMSIHEAVALNLPRPELFVAGIPCQPFSAIRTTVSGAVNTKREKGAHGGDHPLIDMATWTVVLLAKLQPRTVVLECVGGLLNSETGSMVQTALRRLGYHVDAKVVSPHEHGWTMKRARAVIVGQTPDANGTVADPWPAEASSTTPLSAHLDALADIPDDAWVTPISHPHLFARSVDNVAKGRGFVIQPVDPTATVVRTITREYGESALRLDQPCVAHPDDPTRLRKFTLAELRRLFTLRPDYPLPTAKTRAYGLIGQAVHVGLFAEIIGRATGRIAAARQTVAATMDVSSVDLPLFAAC